MAIKLKDPAQNVLIKLLKENPEISLGIAIGTYKNKPTEFLVSVTDIDENEDGTATIFPLAMFATKKDLKDINIPDDTIIEIFTMMALTDEEEEENDEFDLFNYNPKGPCQ